VKFRPVRTDVDITLSIIAKITLSKEFSALLKIGQRNIGANVLLFQCDDILCGPVGRVAGELAWMQLPPKPGPPEEIEDRLVFHHF